MNLIRGSLDLIITTWFDQLVGKDVLKIPKVASINVHPGILPAYRGPFPTIWALLHGEKQVGATVHYIDESFDTGPILKQKTIDVPRHKSIIAIDRQIMEIGADLAIEVITEIEAGKQKAYKQEGGQYLSYPTKSNIAELRKKGIKLYSISDFIRCYI